jgi:septal ring factor EnvC (AmiA/AmiB activator)
VKAKLSKEDRAKIFKQHMEIMKLREELINAAKEKQSLEEEIKARNQEVYSLNEKLILIDFSKPESKLSAHIQHLKEQIDSHKDRNIRKVGDLQKLQKCLTRLALDLAAEVD